MFDELTGTNAPTPEVMEKSRQINTSIDAPAPRHEEEKSLAEIGWCIVDDRILPDAPAPRR